MRRYEVDCGCGEIVTVTAAESGQTVNCPGCGATITVGSLRSLRVASNPTAPVSSAARQAPTPTSATLSWTPAQSAQLLGGLLLAVLCAVGAATTIWIESLSKTPEVRQESRRDVASLGADELWREWHSLRDLRLDSVHQPRVEWQRIRKVTGTTRWLLVAGACLSLAMALRVAFFRRASPAYQ